MLKFNYSKNKQITRDNLCENKFQMVNFSSTSLWFHMSDLTLYYIYINSLFNHSYKGRDQEREDTKFNVSVINKG